MNTIQLSQSELSASVTATWLISLAIIKNHISAEPVTNVSDARNFEKIQVMLWFNKAIMNVAMDYGRSN